MKVLLINSVCGIRSTGRICTDIADLLIQRGHDCRIAYGRENVPEKYRKIAIPIGSKPGTLFHGAMSRIFDSSGFGSRRATKKLISEIKAYDPDIVHLHNVHGYYINVELLFDYLKRAGKPVVWTMHDCWLFTGHCAHFDFCGCEKWKDGCFACPQKKEYPASIVFDGSRRNYGRKKSAFTGCKNMVLVSPSKWLADLAGQSFLGGYPVKVIPNGIDTSVFKPTPSGFRRDRGLEDKYIVLGVSSAWESKKGLGDLIRLSEMLGEDHAVVVVGLTPEQKDSLPEGVIGITRTDSTAELAEIYSAADVFVNPTYEDNYPTVNLEASACGTPVLTYATGGSVENVCPDCVVKKGDVEELARRITARDAGCFSAEGIGRKDMADRYFSLYESLLAEGGK